jgi:ferredoxin-type protein NapG
MNSNPKDANSDATSLPITRRTFLGVAGGTVMMLALGGAWRWIDQPLQNLIPPGAESQAALLSRCVKCQKCQEICPTGVIQPVLLRESIVRVGLPRLNLRAGYCNLCLKCTEVCPTGALRPIPKEQVRLGIAKINPDACIAYNWGGCGKCAPECPEKAVIVDDEKRPIVDEAKCNGCGRCEYICPTGSLRAYDISKGKGIVVLAAVKF